MISRRSFGLLAIGSAYGATIHGVRIGASGYSFQSLPLDGAIQAMQQIGLGFVEVWFRHIEPKVSREELRAWRLSTPLKTFEEAGRKYREAGIEPVAYTFDMKEDLSDAELDRGFQMAKAVGVNLIAASTTLTTAKRLLPLMDRYRMEVAFHGHVNAADENQFAGPDSFRKVLAMSPYARINLDIGQYVAAGFDPLPFIREHHDHIPIMHIRDGKRGGATKLPWGAGDTPIREVLQLLKQERYPIVADIEYDYNGPRGAVAEIEACFQFCKSSLD